MAIPRLTLVLAALIACIFPTHAQSSVGFRKVSSWPGFVRGTPTDVDVVGNFAYVAMGEGGLCIVDVTSRTAPVVASRLDLPGNATRIKVLDDYAFLTCGTAGLQIVSIANPSAPILISSFDTAGTALGMGFAYPYVFIADGVNGVVVADLTNLAAPIFATQIQLPGTVYDVEAELVLNTDINTQVTTTNRYLQIVNGTNGFLAYRVTDPLSPQLQQHNVAPPWDARAITRVGREVFWMERSYITRYDFTRRTISNPIIFVNSGLPLNVPITKLVVSSAVGSPSLGFDLFGGSLHYRGILPSGSTDLSVSEASRSQTGAIEPGDGYRYILDNDKGLLIYKSSLVSVTAIGGQASRLKLAGDRLYIADGDQGLQTLKIGANGSLTPLSQFVDQRVPGAFDVAGSNVFGWFGDTNLNILDVKDADQAILLTNAAPVLTPNLSLLVGRDVAIQDGFAYVADAGAISALNIANPAQPVRVSRLTLNASTLNSIAISGTNIIGVDGSGLFSIGVNADKSFTVLQRLTTTPRSGRRVKLNGTIAYVCERAGGLKIYDVSDPTNIVALGSYDTPGNAFSVALSGSFAYVADQQDGVLVLDVSNPANPTLVATLPMSNSPLDFEVRDNRLFVAQGAEGVSVWDIVPKQAQTINFPAIADKTTTNLPFTVSATASSGLPVEFSIVTGPATVENGRVTITGSGAVTIRATQAGNDEFGSVFADQTFTITRAAQTLNVPEITGKTTRSVPFQLSVSSDSGLPVWIVLLGPAYIGSTGFVTNNGIVTITGAGTVTIRATQDGNNIWAPAQIERTFTVIDSPRDQQTINMPELKVVSIDDEPFDFPISASSGLPVDVTVSGPVTLDGGMMTVMGEGLVTITASQAGNSDFDPVTLTRTFTVYDLPGAATANVIARNPSLPAADTLPDADPDHDGLPNIVEFILRSDPTSATSPEGHTTAAVVQSGGAYYLKAHYLQPRTLRYPVGVQVADFAAYPNLMWISIPAGFNSDGTGDYFWPLGGNYQFPVIRFVVQYP